MMRESSDLEISLHRRNAATYVAEMRFSQPDSESDMFLGRQTSLDISLDMQALQEIYDDPQAYSRLLTETFFANPDVQSAYLQARAGALSMGASLRLRLLVGPSAPELHSLRWELLRDPQDGALLAASEDILFSRYLTSDSWRPVRLRSKDSLRVLVMVANPDNLSEYNLDPVDAAGELERARQALGQISVCALPEQPNGRRATLNALVELIRDQAFDIVYLVCHGRLVRGEPWLWLEDDQGQVARTSGAELVSRIEGLEKRPRLFILASCESGGSLTGSALAALGPRLAQAGIPAVLAMQDRIQIDTVNGFMPVFFRELERDGQIDRAAAAARAAVSRQPDFWVPALYLRMKSGRIWYVPGFGIEQEAYEKWASLASFIKEKTCTPIIGPGLMDMLIGSRRDIAIRWAEKSGFPLAPQDREVLPRVTQYISTHQSPAYLSFAIREATRDALLDRYQDTIPPDLRQADPWTPDQISQAITYAMRQYTAENPHNPYRRLAEMRLPLYITTTPFDLLSDALKEAGSEPVMRVCPWSKWIPRNKALYEDTPTPEKPLIYHLFGHISLPNSQVYTEDQFFDYLIGVTLNKSLIPAAVRAALTNSSLLFLGFQMDDWEFRVFFRYLMAQEGREMLKFFSHVSAQVEPEEDRIIDVKRAHRYLEDYFENENIGIYWGGTEEFLSELQEHL